MMTSGDGFYIVMHMRKLDELFGIPFVIICMDLNRKIGGELISCLPDT